MATRAEQPGVRSSGGEPGGARWRSRAFGLEIEGSFPAPGLPATNENDVHAPRTRLEVVPRADIDEGWRAHEAQRVLEEWFGGKTPARTIDHHDRLGYRLYARHFGLARIDADGSRVRCAPPGVTPWRWQRFLVGRVLPWAALLQGLEVFHASAVRIADRAVAVMGPTGSGKTSVAIQLVLRGASFMTDDVLAIDRVSGGLRAHPGAAIVGVRDAERALIGRRGMGELGEVLGHSDKWYVELERRSPALPLGVVYFLVPRDEGAAPRIQPMPAPDPRLLLASTFVYSVQTPQRLRNQLDICADLARTVPAFTAAVESGDGAAALAARIDAHAQAVIGTAA
jgi:hypothetical protein